MWLALTAPLPVAAGRYGARSTAVVRMCIVHIREILNKLLSFLENKATSASRESTLPRAKGYRSY